MKKTIIAATALLIAGVFLVFGWKTYPALSGDSPVFIPTAIQLAAGDGWANGIAWLYPAPLFPMIVSWLMPAPTPQDAFFVLSTLAALNVLLCGLLFYKSAVWRKRSLSWYDALLVVASLGGIATWLVPGEGRPEVFAALLLLTGALAFLYWNARWRHAWLWLLFSVLLSLMAASNPNGAALFGLLILALCSLRHRGAQWGRSIAVVLSVPMLALYSAPLLYPKRVASMIRRTISVGASLLTPDYLINPTYSISTYYVTEPHSFCYGFVLLFALGGGLHLLYRNRKKVASPKMFIFFSTLFLFLAYYTALRQPNRRYNLLLFAPVFFALGIYYVSYLNAHGSLRGKATQIAYTVLVLITSAGFARNVAMFPSYLHDGMALGQARAALRELHILDKAASDEIIVSRSTWALSQKYDKMRYCPAPRRCGSGARWFIAPQQHSGRKTPRKNVGDYVLTHDFFVPKTPRLLGIKIANSMRGYSFAVYRKTDPAPSASRRNDHVQ